MPGAADDATASSVTAQTFTVNADADSVLTIAYQDGNAYFFKTDGANAGSIWRNNLSGGGYRLIRTCSHLRRGSGRGITVATS